MVSRFLTGFHRLPLVGQRLPLVRQRLPLVRQ
jgi:hypothetical protein